MPVTKNLEEYKEIVNPEIQNYINNLYSPKDDILCEMEYYANENRFPIIDESVGRFLYQTVWMKKPERILELGFGFGYSSYWFVKAIKDSGIDCKVYGIEYNTININKAYDFFRIANADKYIEIYEGNAVKVIDTFSEPFDLIFNDINKYLYPRIIKKIVNHLSKGGLLITDNVLWKGAVLQDNPEKHSVRGIVSYNKTITEHPQLNTTILPVHDGLAVSIKVK